MADKQILNFINGEFVAAKSGKTFENRSPVDNRLVGMVSRRARKEVDAAVKAALAALEGPWGVDGHREAQRAAVRGRRRDQPPLRRIPRRRKWPTPASRIRSRSTSTSRAARRTSRSSPTS